jgi:Glycine zipper 2TM domain
MMGHPMGHPPMDARYEQARADWLGECRRNHRGRDRDGGLGGAAIGGVVGGVIGNRVAGRGDRVVGTIAGAAVGAVAGAAIDRADGAGRERVGDWCERYLEQYSGGYGQAGYGNGYGGPVMLVPVVMVQQQQAQPCTETITTTEYVTVERRRPPAGRVIYRAVPDKRVRIAPAPSGKRVRM